MFFGGEDAIAVYTLANAVLEIFEGRPQKKPARSGSKSIRFRLFDALRKAYPNLSDEEAWERIFEAKNFFKHGGSLEASVTFHEEANVSVLLFASAHCQKHTAQDTPPEVNAFILWFMATQPITEEPEILGREIGKHFPGMRTASSDEKMRLGAMLISDAVAGRLPMVTGAGNWV
jgi:hypothetical protein